MQPGWQAGDVGGELGGGVEPVGVLEQVGERARRSASVGREPGERAEVGVGVDSDRAKLEVGGEQVARDERAGGLADAAFRADQRDRVRSRDARLGADPPLEFGLVALGLGDEQPLQLAAQPPAVPFGAGRPSTSAAG